MKPTKVSQQVVLGGGGFVDGTIPQVKTKRGRNRPLNKPPVKLAILLDRGRRR